VSEDHISDEMIRDWREHREQLLALWKSGRFTTTDNLAAFGIEVDMPPWLFECGNADAEPWAACLDDADGWGQSWEERQRLRRRQ
jgi:hypothetical protein